MTNMQSDLSARAERYLRESAELKQRIAEHCLDSIMAAAQTITGAFRTGNKLMLCGNGGSAADCQHMAAEFVGVLNKNKQRPGLPAIALTTDSSFLTAYTNDWGGEGVFARQVEALGREGDVLLAISTSGNSPNVIRAVEAAAGAGLRTIALLGEGGQLSERSDVVISVPSTNTQHIQEAHLAIEHTLCELVELMLYGGDR